MNTYKRIDNINLHSLPKSAIFSYHKNERPEGGSRDAAMFVFGVSPQDLLPASGSADGGRRDPDHYGASCRRQGVDETGGEIMNPVQERELFEEKSVVSAVFRLAFPTVIGQIILVLYNMADTFFVGMTGNDAMLAAVTVCMPAFMFLSAISNLFGVGAASVIARAMGARETDRAKKTSAFAFWGCLAVTALYSLAAYLFRDVFMDLLGGTDPQVHRNAVEYLTCTVVFGGVLTSLSVLFSHLIRAEGRAVHASVGIGIGGALNIALDPLFMFVILPPGREALGAAIATTISNLVSLLYFVLVLLRIRKRSLLRLRFSIDMFRQRIPAAVFAAGLPACVMTLFENVSYAVLDKLMSYAGLSMQAGIGVAKKVNMLAHCMVRGISQGSLPLIAYNYASKNMERMRASVRVSHMASIIVATVCMVMNLTMARQLIGVFIHTDSASLRYGTDFLRILCIGGPFSASAYTIISFFQATGHGKKSFLLAVLRKGIVDIPLMLILNLIIPVYGIVMATPLADGFCCVVANVMLIAFLK